MNNFIGNFLGIEVFQITSSFEVRFVDHPGGCERPHTHPSLVISAVVDGAISLQINNNEIRLNKGMVAILGPNMLHSVRSYADNFSGIYVLEIFGLPADCQQFSAIHFQLFRSFFLNGNASFNEFVNLCRELLSTMANDEKTKLLSTWLSNLFTIRYLATTDEFSKDYKKAVVICEMLDNFKGETIPFNAIAQSFGLSKERCNRIFRNVYNISMQGYFLNKKASDARNLLASDYPLSEIALECGFYDQSHFSRIFKEIFQISPAKYRSLIGSSRQSYTRQN